MVNAVLVERVFIVDTVDICLMVIILLFEMAKYTN